MFVMGLLGPAHDMLLCCGQSEFDPVAVSMQAGVPGMLGDWI